MISPDDPETYLVGYLGPQATCMAVDAVGSQYGCRRPNQSCVFNVGTGQAAPRVRPRPRAAPHACTTVPPSTPIGTRPSSFCRQRHITLAIPEEEGRAGAGDGPAREGVRRRARTSAGGHMHAEASVCPRQAAGRARVSGSSGVGEPVGGGNGKPNRRSDGTILLGGPFRGPRVKSGGRARAIRLPSPVPFHSSADLLCLAWMLLGRSREGSARTCRKRRVQKMVSQLGKLVVLHCSLKKKNLYYST